MNRLAKLPTAQLNLLLVNAPKAAIPDDKQKELAMALMELLIQATQEERAERRVNGGEDERKAER